VPVLVVSTLLLSACRDGDGVVVSPAVTRPDVAPDASVSPGSGPPDARVPAPEEPIAGDPDGIAGQLESSSVALDREIDRWVEGGDPSAWPPPRDLELLALLQQRIYRTLARDRALARATLRRLPDDLARVAAANTEAIAGIVSHAVPVASADVVRTRVPEPAGVLLAWFREAERRFGVAWEVLAAVMLVESRFGRVVSRSWAGAQGPMQFLPSTWEAYGLGGDVREPHDAILGAANYLHASGAPGDERRALYAYNPVREYVDGVLAYAGVMRRDPRAYLAYYNWQVFVVTVDGDVRVTGPGLAE
jgi:hypothetical protein